MAKIILTEAQFKDYTRMLLKEERKAQFTDKVIREVLSEMDVYKEQMLREIQIFLLGLENRQALVDDKQAAVPYPEIGEYENDEPTRWIVYEYDHPGYLRDDGFSIQYIPVAEKLKIRIENAIYNKYGVTVPEEY
jgi:hypothetical protein